jgi:hypothetical protein
MIASHSFELMPGMRFLGWSRSSRGCLGCGHQGSLKFLNKTRPTIDQVSIQN